MKYYIRNQDGELCVPSFAELRVLYQRQFISDDDEIRREDSHCWTKAGNMQNLRALKFVPFLRSPDFVWFSIIIAICALMLVWRII